MKKFQEISSTALPIPMNNIDTDTIIPGRFLKTIERTGLGKGLFFHLRHNKDGSKNEDFVLNKNIYQNAQIIIAGENFGCGSSREHAAWAIKDFGIKTILAESFADIFYNNCFKNGILPIVLDKDIMKTLFRKCVEDDKFSLKIDLDNQIISGSNNEDLSFDIDPYRKKALLKGLDEIGQTLEDIDLISDFEQKHKKTFPWLF